MPAHLQLRPSGLAPVSMGHDDPKELMGRVGAALVLSLLAGVSTR
jgi:hypothetical protein